MLGGKRAVPAIVLLYGEDGGLVRERADAIVAAVTEGDALRVVEIAKDAHRDTGLLAAEAATLPLVGGRKAVRVREASDAFAPAVRAVLAAAASGAVVLEAGDLPRHSKLRALVEEAPDAAALACARERGSALLASIEVLLAELGVTATPDAIRYLADRSDDDRQVLRRECEKLALFVGTGGRADLEHAMAAAGDGQALESDIAVAAALAADVAVLDAALEAEFAEGASAVQMVRNALWQTQRLAGAALAVASGASPGDAVAAARPPVYFKQRAQLERALRLWDATAAAAAAQNLLRAERRTKSTGYPDEAVARQTLLGLAISRASRR